MSLEEKLGIIEGKIIEAEKNVEQVDTTSFIIEKAQLYKENKTYERKLTEHKIIIEKTQSFNLKMEAVFDILHISLLQKDIKLLEEYLGICRKFLIDGGDWEKKKQAKSL